mmetsp:Transcript_33124/g.52700  ORF Transcript_33124/g.52700 Transcript_33124/m.52700 type:complete len:567 (-) Transcript_33124:30-1730(-)
MGVFSSTEVCPEPTVKDSNNAENPSSSEPPEPHRNSSSHSDPALQQTVERTVKGIGSMATTGRYHLPPKHVDQDYERCEKVLGSGYNGDVHLAMRKMGKPSTFGNEQKFAVKEFKLRGANKAKREELQQECEIFLQMDHPHVARLTDVYEEEDKLTLVMECMEGGELFDRVIEKKKFPEKDAARAAYQMALALNYLHSHGIVHRDIKLENWLYEKKDTDHLKLIDFGFSKRWDPSQESKMKASCGTLSYVAPEVLSKNYTSKCDMWSLGVVMFILLAGYMPFSGPDDVQIKKIKAANINWKQDKWKNVSGPAKDFVNHLIVVLPEVRMSAEQALKHKWLTSSFEAEVDAIDSKDIASSMYEFAQASKFRRTCMLAMAWSLTNDERSKVRQAFLKMDQNKHGTITLGEFKTVIEENFHLSDERIEELFNAIDAAHNHEIQYSEFLAAMVSSRIDLHDDLICSAFKRFDTDNSGYIDAANLKAVLVESSDAEIEEMMKEVDANHDGKISTEEFMQYIRSGRAKEQHQETVHTLIDKEKGLLDEDDGELVRQESSKKVKPSPLIARQVS